MVAAAGHEGATGAVTTFAIVTGMLVVAVLPELSVAVAVRVWTPLEKDAVLIDALIDENGRVSSMRVVSGPVLLHQSAMEALKQWKYQAATLDGKAVSMHLTVTVQFRLQ